MSTLDVSEDVSGEDEASEKQPEKKKSARKKSVRKKSVRKQSVKDSGKKRLSMQKGKSSKLSITKDIMEDQNPLQKTGQGIFKFKNHDRYIGDFRAVWPNELVREGYGVYSTHDGLVYKGTWSEDYLKEGTVQWPCGQRYVGTLSEGKYSGVGKYHVPGRGELIAHFENNMPKGKVAFVDQAGLTYAGEIKENDEILTLTPLNHYLPVNIEELIAPDQSTKPKPHKKTK